MRSCPKKHPERKSKAQAPADSPKSSPRRRKPDLGSLSGSAAIRCRPTAELRLSQLYNDGGGFWRACAVGEVPPKLDFIGRPMLARFWGYCRVCDRFFSAGDTILFDGLERNPRLRVAHFNCGRTI